MKKLIIACGLLFYTIMTTAQKPNIVIVYADDLGFGDLTVNNPKSKIPTPNLDKLANEGINFIDGHSSSGVCTPSRYAILTGRYHWRKFYDITGAYEDSMFDDERLTLPEMMQASGYKTVAMGKWHLGMGWSSIFKKGAKQVRSEEYKRNAMTPEGIDWTKPIPNGPNKHGFDYYFGEGIVNMPPYVWIENDRVLEVPTLTHLSDSDWRKAKHERDFCRPGPMIEGWDPYTVLPTVTDKAVEYIKAQKDSEKPFFMYLALSSPHGPVVPNDEFDGTSEAGPYGDFVVETDYSCGRVFKALEEAGLAENTIVVFSADNGPENIAHGVYFDYGHWSSTPFRGVKRDIYEGGHHVPFIVKWPKKVKAGVKSDALISQIDLMATFADIVDYKLPDNQAEDSHNMLPVFLGKKKAVRTSMVHNTREKDFAIRDGEWVLVFADGEPQSKLGTYGNSKWEKENGYPTPKRIGKELYHISEDLGQRYNLSDNNPEKVEKMSQLLTQIRDQGYSAPRIK